MTCVLYLERLSSNLQCLRQRILGITQGFGFLDNPALMTLAVDTYLRVRRALESST